MSAVWSLLLAGEEPIDALHWRLRFVGESLEGFAYPSGQPVAVRLTNGHADLRLACRVEEFDPVELRLDVILARGAAVERWAQDASIGDPVMVELGTRGNRTLERPTRERSRRFTAGDGVG
jgi:hypothetical protein